MYYIRCQVIFLKMSQHPKVIDPLRKAVITGPHLRRRRVSTKAVPEKMSTSGAEEVRCWKVLVVLKCFESQEVLEDQNKEPQK